MVPQPSIGTLTMWQIIRLGISQQIRSAQMTVLRMVTLKLETSQEEIAGELGIHQDVLTDQRGTFQQLSATELLIPE